MGDALSFFAGDWQRKFAAPLVACDRNLGEVELERHLRVLGGSVDMTNILGEFGLVHPEKIGLEEVDGLSIGEEAAS